MMKPVYGYFKTHGGFYLAKENSKFIVFCFQYIYFSLSIFIFAVIEFC